MSHTPDLKQHFAERLKFEATYKNVPTAGSTVKTAVWTIWARESQMMASTPATRYRPLHSDDYGSFEFLVVQDAQQAADEYDARLGRKTPRARIDHIATAAAASLDYWLEHLPEPEPLAA